MYAIPLVPLSCIRKKLWIDDRWCLDTALDLKPLYKRQDVTQCLPIVDDALTLVLRKTSKTGVANLSATSQKMYFRVGSNEGYWKRFIRKLSIPSSILNSAQYRHPAFLKEIVIDASNWIVPYSKARDTFYKPGWQGYGTRHRFDPRIWGAPGTYRYETARYEEFRNNGTQVRFGAPITFNVPRMGDLMSEMELRITVNPTGIVTMGDGLSGRDTYLRRSASFTGLLGEVSQIA